MSHAQRNKQDTSLWQPSATRAALRARAQLYQNLRQFFAIRDILEVETPILCRTTVTDPYIASIPAQLQLNASAAKQTFYLQTSPEYAMKRLLAAGSGPIFQITKTFRQGEVGNQHNPEFTMLEWYRPGYNHLMLMEEVDELLRYVLNTPPAQRETYAALFSTFLGLDPHQTSIGALQIEAKKRNLSVEGDIHNRDTWLNLLMSHFVEPHLGANRPIFIYDFPASQAALARLNSGLPMTAARFEVYYQGMELANGFYELQDAKEQRERFIKNQTIRFQEDLPHIDIDELFLAALPSLPDCSGVALGLDRILMVMLNTTTISDVLSFDYSRV